MLLRRAAHIVCLFVLVAGPASHAEELSLTNPIAGFDGVFLPGSWVPVHTSLASPSAPFRGDVVFTVSEAGTTRYRIIRPVEMDAAGNLPIEIVIPTPASEFDVDVAMRPDEGASRNAAWTFSAPARSGRIVLVVGRPGALDLLNRIRGTMVDNASVVYVGPDELPADPLGYDTIDTVVLYDSRLARLSTETVAALDVWVRRGGRVITIGGPHLSTADGTVVRPLLPGRTGNLTRGMPSEWNTLFPLGIIGRSGNILYSRFHPDEGAQTVPRRGIPIIAYEDRGKGSLSFVATGVGTLGRIAMPGSGIWREAFPPLSPVGRVRVPTMIRRTVRDSVVGEAIVADGPRLFPRRGSVALVGLLYVVLMAVLTRRLSRSHLPARAAVLRPATLAMALSVLMLLGAAGGSWTRPAMIAEGELFRGAALSHGSEPTPGIVEKDLIAASRTGATLEIGLPAALQPVPLAGRTVSVRQGASQATLLTTLGRVEQNYHYLQMTLSLDVTAGLALSSRGMSLSLRNASIRDLSDAVVLWNGRLFEVGDIERGTTFRTNLGAADSERSTQRSMGAERARMLRRFRDAVSGIGPVLIAFIDQPLVPVSVSSTYGRSAVTVAMFSLQHPLSRGIRTSR